MIGPSLDAARTAASLAGAKLDFDEAGKCVRVLIPAGQISQTVVRADARVQD